MGNDYADPQLAAFDEAEFNAEAARRIEALKAAPTLEDARNRYRALVLPCEAERLRREAQRRRDQGEEPFDLLFVTVGAQADSPALAIIATPARFVVLLHTNKEQGHAEEVVNRLGLLAKGASLRSIGDGTRILDLYRVCFDEWQTRGRPRRVAFDLTGGLKTMSAGAAAAGFAIPGGAVFYIEADQPRIHGTNFWINERRINLENPFVVFGEIRRESARALLASRAYPAAAVLYQELAGQTRQPGDDFRARLAKGYAAFDALRFEEAASILGGLAHDLDARERDTPALRHDVIIAGRAQVRANAEGAHLLRDLVSTVGDQQNTDPLTERKVLVADGCREFIALLLAAAARQHAARQFDVAGLLAYRASEAVVTRRLALRGGIDPSNVDWHVLTSAAGCGVADFVKRYNDASKNKEYHLDANSLPSRLGRAPAFNALAAAFPDDVALAIDIKKFGGLGEARNRSLLAHGFSQLSERTANQLLESTECLFNRMLEIEAVAPADRDALRQRYRFLDVERDWVDRTG